MKAIIIYVNGNIKSKQQAIECFGSCKKLGYDVMTMHGSTPDSMKIDFPYSEIEDARVRIFKKENHKKYLAKKACFSNHIRIWKHVVKTNEEVLVLEHDAVAVEEWDSPQYDEVLVLNMKSAMSRSIAHAVKPPDSAYEKEGVQDIKDSGSKLIYNRKNLYTGSYMMPGTASYVINPVGANKLLTALSNGWEQSDYFMNTHNINIKYTTPDYFILNQNNLQMSHGIL